MSRKICPYIECEDLINDRQKNIEDYADRVFEQCTTTLHQQCPYFKKLNQNDVRKYVYETYKLGK